ncbi:MAG: hypothetical protein J7M30_10260, partial [Deltaproteobacteria bacterium]|nr:hypothetical protein [Deltaproteobacteria bacterium]
MIEKQVFFLNIIGRGEAFSKHRFQMSGFRLALAFSLLTPDTRHLKPMLREGFTTPDNVQKKDLFFNHVTRSERNMLK